MLQLHWTVIEQEWNKCILFLFILIEYYSNVEAVRLRLWAYFYSDGRRLQVF